MNTEIKIVQCFLEMSGKLYLEEYYRLRINIFRKYRALTENKEKDFIMSKSKAEEKEIKRLNARLNELNATFFGIDV